MKHADKRHILAQLKTLGRHEKDNKNDLVKDQNFAEWQHVQQDVDG